MIRTVEAIIDEHGNVRLLEPIQLPARRRALVTLLEERHARQVADSAFLSQAALAQDWDRPEEDDAWAHLQAGRIVRISVKFSSKQLRRLRTLAQRRGVSIRGTIVTHLNRIEPAADASAGTIRVIPQSTVTAEHLLSEWP